MADTFGFVPPDLADPEIAEYVRRQQIAGSWATPAVRSLEMLRNAAAAANPLGPTMQGYVNRVAENLPVFGSRVRALEAAPGEKQSGALLPIMSNEQGQMWLSPNAGIPGSVIRGVGLAGDVMAGKTRIPSYRDVPQEEMVETPAFRLAPPDPGSIAAKVGLTNLPSMRKTTLDEGMSQIGDLVGLVAGGGIPAAEAGAVGAAGGGLRHGVSKVVLPKPVEEMTSVINPTTARPDVVIAPERLQGSEIVPILGDRTRSGGDLMQVNGYKFDQPVALQGGPTFGRDNPDAAWAATFVPAKQFQGRVDRIGEETGRPVMGAHVSMAERSGDFSHMNAGAVAQMLPHTKLTKAAQQIFDQEIRNKGVADWPGVGSEKLPEYLAQADKGEVRKTFMKMVDTSRYQKLGFPSAAEARVATTDPALLNAPTGAAGRAIVQLEPGTDIRPGAHGTYTHDIPGRYVGGLSDVVPHDVMFPKMSAQLEQYRSLLDLPEHHKPRTIDMLSKTPQGVRRSELADQQWVDSVSQHLENRGFTLGSGAVDEAGQARAAAATAGKNALDMSTEARMARAAEQGFGDNALRNTWAGQMLDDPEYGVLPHVQERYKPIEREWYHGTQADFDEFKTGGVARQTKDWNTMLGPHFSDHPGVASQFAEGLYSKTDEGGRVIPAQLNISSPKRYKTETDMSDDAVRWAVDNGLLTAADFRKGGMDARGVGEEIAKTGKVPDWGYGFGGEILQQAGRKRKQIADGFRKSLQEAGHDGIVYGNNVEGVATTAAIPFDTSQVRSRFAAFDPANRGSGKLLGSGSTDEAGQLRSAAVNAGMDALNGPAGAEAAGAAAGAGRVGGRARSVAEAQAQAARIAAGAEPLAGLPNKPLNFGGDHYVPGPIGTIRKVAEDYMAGTGRPYEPPKQYHPIDKDHSTAIAKAFDEMKHAPDDPAVKASYDALIDETLAQFQAIKKSGLKIEFIKPGMEDPYFASPRLAAVDVADNNHLWVFPTESGFGTVSKISDNPMLRPTDEVIDGHKMVANDVFRIVHDYFGHLKEGHGFRAAGEDNAWRAHSSMYSDLARPAMTSETRGQNSWVNYGPHGEKNRTANAAETTYADQKVGIMPEWTMRDRGSQPPVIAYHGSPHKHGKFESKYLGTGEGEEVYGRGHYMAQAEDTAKHYRDILSKQKEVLQFQGKPVDTVWNEGIRETWGDYIKTLPKNQRETFVDVMSNLSQVDRMQHVPHVVQSLSPAERKVFDERIMPHLMETESSPGHLYQVALDVNPDHLLNWDKIFREQTTHVRDAMMPDMLSTAQRAKDASEKLLARPPRDLRNASPLARARQETDRQKWAENLRKSPEQMADETPGSVAYRSLGLPAVDAKEAYGKATKRALEVGVPGIKYLDQASRPDIYHGPGGWFADVGEKTVGPYKKQATALRNAEKLGTSNYVVFDDKLIRILKRYGILLPGAGAAGLAELAGGFGLAPREEM